VLRDAFDTTIPTRTLFIQMTIGQTVRQFNLGLPVVRLSSHMLLYVMYLGGLAVMWLPGVCLIAGVFLDASATITCSLASSGLSSASSCSCPCQLTNEQGSGEMCQTASLVGGRLFARVARVKLIGW
jgi:hypothetical protein